MSTSTITYRLTSEFGVLEKVRDGRSHTGIDLAMPKGTELRTIESGTVEKIFSGEGSLGEGLMIKTDDETYHIYGHLSDVKVKIGEKIEKGDLIGLSGNTGNSTGPHLHFAIKENGKYVNPENSISDIQSVTGDNYDSVTIVDFIKNPEESIGKIVKENAKEFTNDILLGSLEAIRDVAVDMIGAIALVGGGILIIAKVAGFDKGYKWAGILFVSNVLVKYLFGGNISE